MRWLIVIIFLALPVASFADAASDAEADALEESQDREDRDPSPEQQHRLLLHELEELMWCIRSECIREDVSRRDFDGMIDLIRQARTRSAIPVELKELGTSEEQLVACVRVHEEALTRAANRKRWQQENAARRASK